MTTHRTRRRIRTTVPTLALVFALVIGAAHVVGADDGDVADVPRWFTTEQAERGEETYASACAHCHGNDLDGNPPLVGEFFLDRFDDVWALYDQTRETMPEDDPGSLSDETYGEVIAYVLERNGFEAGDDELDVEDRDALEAMELDAAVVADDEGGGTD